jgi:hypothetical protein
LTISHLPTAGLTSITRVPRVATGVSTSPFTGTQQVQNWGGEWWEFQMEFMSTSEDVAMELSAFLTGLRGPVGTFLLHNPADYNPETLGSPVVAAANQTGYSLQTSGWLPSRRVLAAGRFISLGSGGSSRLHQVTQKAVSAADGTCTLSVWPALRAGHSPFLGSPVQTRRPTCLLRLTSTPGAAIQPPVVHRFSVQAREVL